jgi:hypothetical protein
MAWGFALAFFGLSVTLGGIALEIIWHTCLDAERTLAEGLLKSLNMAGIALATCELGLNVHKESVHHEDSDDILLVLRRTISRCVSIVCIALVLEGLIMVIKYSQLDLAGNHPSPVAILTSAAVLLVALGTLLFLTRDACRHAARFEPEPSRVIVERGAEIERRPQGVTSWAGHRQWGDAANGGR